MTNIILDKTDVKKIIGNLNDEKINETLSMFGTCVERISEDEIEIEITPNRPDMLSKQGFLRAIESYFKTGKKQLLIVKGEEDLLALPTILLTPLHSVVLYGQIDMGVIMVEVTEEKKRQVEDIIKKFN